MSDLLISQYIDNELNLDEKIVFVKKIHADQSYTQLTEELLEQEKILCAEIAAPMPQAPVAAYPPLVNRVLHALRHRLKMFAFPLLAMAVLVCMILVYTHPEKKHVAANHEMTYRFVLYNPGASKAEVIGSFSKWRPLPMERIGSSGYWSATIKLPEGEYTYSYLLDAKQRITDPTVNLKEHDDFGGENSVLKLKSTI